MLRMKNERIVKPITLRWPVILEDQRKHRQAATDYDIVTIEEQVWIMSVLRIS